MSSKKSKSSMQKKSSDSKSFLSYLKPSKKTLIAAGVGAAIGGGIQAKILHNVLYEQPKKYLTESEKKRYDELMKKVQIPKMAIVNQIMFGGDFIDSFLKKCEQSKNTDDCKEFIALMFEARKRSVNEIIDKNTTSYFKYFTNAIKLGLTGA